MLFYALQIINYYQIKICAHVLLFLPYTFLSLSILLGLRFIHNSIFPSHPPFVLTGTFVQLFRLCLMFTIYLARPERISSRPLFYSSTSICTLKINHLYYGLYWTRSHSFIGFRGCGTAVLLPNKRGDREVQPLASLYPTIRPSPWRQVRKNIHSSVWTPGPT